jgi:hypothetical protein
MPPRPTFAITFTSITNKEKSGTTLTSWGMALAGDQALEMPIVSYVGYFRIEFWWVQVRCLG